MTGKNGTGPGILQLLLSDLFLRNFRVIPFSLARRDLHLKNVEKFVRIVLNKMYNITSTSMSGAIRDGSTIEGVCT